MAPITDRDILALVRDLVGLPFPTVCRHWVASKLLSLLESKGWDCPEALAAAVVDADDEEASSRLQTLIAES